MSFINGALLGFLALGAVPILIHLLMKRRFKIVVWAAMEFLLASLEQNRRRLQLRDLILMLIRTAAVLFLVLSLARPSVTGKAASLFGGRGTVGAVILLDNSYSMGFHTGREERFEIAKRMARTVIGSLSKGSRVGVTLFSDVADREIPRPVHDLATAERVVTAAPLTGGGTDIATGIEAAWKTLADADAVQKEIYLVTDMQARGWPDPKDTEFAERLREISKKSTFFILNVGEGRTENLAATGLKLDDEFASTDMPVSFTVTARNFGTTPQQGVPVDLFIDDRKSATRTVDVGPHETASVTMHTRFTTGGDHKVRAQLGVDRLLADNERFLSVDVLDVIRVLIVDGQPGEDETGWGSESAFLKFALSPIDYTDPDSKTLIRTEVVQPLAAGERRYADYHAIVLANVGEIPAGRVERLRRFVNARGGLVIFPGSNVDPERYNSIFSTGGDPLLPCSLAAPYGDAEAKEEPFTLSTGSLEHPIVGYFGLPENKPYLAAPKFYRAFELKVPETREDEDGEAPAIVARFSDGKPAIVEKKVGLGRVIVFASTADLAWNTFPLRPAFLPVARRTVEYVTTGARAQRNIDVHAPIRAPLDLKDVNVQCTVLGPKGNRMSMEPTPFEQWAYVEVAETPFQGFYTLTLQKDPEETVVFAANCNTKESLLDQLTQDDLKKRYPDFSFKFVDSREDLKSVITSERVGIELWPYLLALVCVLLLLESFLAARWAPKE